MSNGYKGVERRRHPRISQRFIVRFQPRDQKDSNWEVSTINNISEGGCFFYSDALYKVGEILEIAIQFPILRESARFIGEVKRCEFDENQQPKRYGIAVCFLEMDGESKNAFLETINFFLKKQQK